MSEFTSKLKLAYYDGSDGPRIMIFGSLESDLNKLQNLFQQLHKNPNELIELDQEPFITVYNDVELTLCTPVSRFAQERQLSLGLRLVSGRSNPAFTWCRTSDNWDYLDCLLDSLTKSKGPGHQYLTSYPSESAIVVISKGEYRDDIVEC